MIWSGYYETQTDEEHLQQTWRALRLFLVYRLVLVAALGFAFFSGTGPSLIGSAAPQLFGFAITVYLGFVISSGLFLLWRSPAAEQQIEYTIFIDILAITLLMHASGGVRSGLGLLIAISIANASLLMAGRLAMLFAALGSLAVLTEQVYAHLSDSFPQTAYTQAGLLGVTFFAVALLAFVLSSRLRETQKLVEQRSLDLADMAQLNEYIIQHMNTGVLVIDKDDTIRLMNETAWQLLGMPDTQVGLPLGRNLPELSVLVHAWRRDTRVAPPTFQIPAAGRELKPSFAPLGPDAHAGTLIFLDDNERVGEQAQQMKLASLGRLTASIAHEIRNPLGAISHAGQLLGESPELSKGDRRLTEIIQSNSLRVNDVIESVLQLSRRDGARPEAVALKAWVREFLDEFCRARRLDCSAFKVSVESQPASVQVDPRQLRQVLTNLCDNALKFSAKAADPSVRINGGRLADKPYPVLEVIDNGPGVAPEHVRQIFEPFFTTGAKGTGLGLYIAKELCDINKIELEYLPNPAGGSCFRLGFRSWTK